MIGHQLTAFFGIDHAKILAVIQPAVWKLRKEQKKEKRLKYAERVWGISEGDETCRVNKAIKKAEEFFVSLGMKTRLS